MSLDFYTMGFVFAQGRVLLLEKKTGLPCLIGKYNGVGGHVEKGEAPWQCMMRELSEEAKMPTAVFREENFAFVCPGGLIYVWRIDVPMVVPVADIVEGHFEWFPINELPENCCENIRWMIPLCLLDIDRVVITQRTWGT